MPKSVLSTCRRSSTATARDTHKDTHTQIQSECVCVRVCACHFINKTNKQSKYIYVKKNRSDCSTNLLLLLVLLRICARVNPQRGGGLSLLLPTDPLFHLPLLPTPGEPITAIFNSVSVDFLRLIRVVISTFCNRPVYLAIYLFIYLVYSQLYLSGCLHFFNFFLFFSLCILSIYPLASVFDHNKRKMLA